MWVFAYGSLMADGWERAHDCIARTDADLSGCRRSFNKRSQKNWGTKLAPGVTLNLERVVGASCSGVAFEFAGDVFDEKLRAYLRKREACDPTAVSITLKGGHKAEAWVYIYEDKKNLLPVDMTLEQKAAMVLAAARGDSGTGYEYVRNAFAALEAVGVSDPAVTALWNAVRRDC